MLPCRLSFVLVGMFSVPGLAVLRTTDSREGTFFSEKDHILKNHVIGEHDVTDKISCTLECVAEPKCRSANFKKGASSSGNGAKCQLNDATRFSARKEDYQPNQEYDHVFDLDEISLSCSQIKATVPSSASGYYFVKDFSAKFKARMVYCDMEKHEGGWTLVASISNTNNNHLQRNKVNCLNKTLCVEYTTTNIQTRKLSDDDIHIMADTEGVFRVDVLKSTPYTTFFKIPSGSQNFSSSCDGSNCPRLITSHYYPYQWESNCKGTTLGYKFGHSGTGLHCYQVFDNEAFECSTAWYSSKHSTERVLYGSTCNGNQGINPNQNGFLFVR